jgi:PAS domain S-box-containing protein
MLSAGKPAHEELLELILASAVDYAIFSLDPEGRVTMWNAGAERVLGFTSDQIMGRSADLIFTPEDRAQGVPEMERRQALAARRAEDDRWQMRRDGTRFWASGLMMRLADPTQGFVKVLRDQTQRHRTEEERRQAEERFRLLAINIPQLVFRCLSDGTRTWPSPQWIKFTGLGSAESLGFGWLDAIHPQDREATMAAWHGAEAAGAYYVEHRVRRAQDGEYRWHQTRAQPIQSPAGTTSVDWVGTMTDVHDLRGLQARQQVLLAELQHRTRNLLAVVQAIAAQTLRNSDSLESFGAEYEGRLAALGRVQAMLSNVKQPAVDLRELVGAELKAHGVQIERSEKVQVSGPQVLLPPASAQVLALALHELATNAVKHGALRHDTGTLRIDWRLEESNEGRLTLEWTESNVPMPEGPRRTGYGSELIERALPFELGAETRLDFDPDGVRCVISILSRQEIDHE